MANGGEAARPEVGMAGAAQGGVNSDVIDPLVGVGDPRRDGPLCAVQVPGAERPDAPAVHYISGILASQQRTAAGRELLLLPEGFDWINHISGNFVRQHLPGTGRDAVNLPDGLLGAINHIFGNFAREHRTGAGRDAVPLPNFDSSSVTLVDDIGTGYGNSATPANHLRPLLPYAGMAAATVAVTGLTAGAVQPAAGFILFALLMIGLSLDMIHVLRA